MVIVRVSAVIGCVFAIRTCSSLNHGPLAETTGVAVAGPGPPPGDDTSTASCAVRLRPPPLAVMTTSDRPAFAVLDAVTVTVLVPAAEIGLNWIAMPGMLGAVRDTGAANPPLRATATVAVALAPALIERVAGLTEIAKFGGGGVLFSRALTAGSHRSEILRFPVLLGWTPSAVSAAVLYPVH